MRRKPFSKCVLKQMRLGKTKKEAKMICNKRIRKTTNDSR